MSSLVPGFAQRYPRIDDDEAFWRDFEREAQPASARHSRLDRESLLIESCCTTIDEALAAEARGADRIELCTDLSVGGLTPPRDLIRETVARLSIPVNVLIRPASGSRPAANRHARPDRASHLSLGGFSALDFVYDEEAVSQMESDIAFCRSAGVAGVVVGALTPDGAIDLPAMRRLVAAAGPLSVTFHRAFDVCSEDPFQAVDKIISLLCTRLLTSGMAPTAWEGRELIARLVRHAGDRLIIMPGSGVRPDNLTALAAATSAPEFHGTAIP
jgi:copper homeostasis protein